MSDSISTYFQMGGYAEFVWPAYAIAALVLIGFALSSWRRLRAAQRALERLSEADPNLGDDS
jgi:heme exporter protein D